MSKVIKKNLVPKLRFPAFQGSDRWKVKHLGEICDVLNSCRRPISSGKRKAGKYPYYGASGIVDFVNDYIFQERLVLIGEDGAKWGAYDKTAFIVKGKYWVNNHAHVLRAVSINDCLLENYLVKLDINPFVTGAAPPKLTLGQLKGIPVPVPPTAQEQAKIAACLSSIDNLITAQTQKLDSLKQHKKGLMQQLFPAEGKTVPKLRFPEFQGKGDWVEKRLRDVADIITGNTPNTAETSNYGGGIMFVSPTDITESRYIKNTKTTLSRQGFLKARHIQPNSVLFVCIGSTIGKIAQNIVLCATNQQINALVPIENYSSSFVYFSLDNKSSSISQLAGKQAIPLINKSLFSAISITLPAYTEQTKIADCFSSIDALIDAQTQKLNSLKQHKKGLMQQLFPTNEEVSL